MPSILLKPNFIGKLLLIVFSVLAIHFIQSSTANSAGLFNSKTVTIRNDPGGSMVSYAIRAIDLANAGKTMRFAGRCDSACTLYLGMPHSRMCITRNATFGFHMPYGASAENNRTAANFMMKKYPTWVRDWISQNGGLTGRMKRMSYSYARKFIKDCS